MRLLHLLNTFDPGSLNRLVLNLVRGLDQDRYEWHVACLFGGGELSHELRQAGARVDNFNMQGYHDLGVFRRVWRYICCHDIQLVHTHILRADLVGWLASRVAGGRCLFATKHNPLYAPGQEKRTIRNLLYYLSLYMPDLTITVSDSLRQRLIRLPGLSEGHVVTIHNAIDADSYFVPEAREACRHELGATDDVQLIGYVGRLVAGKGLETLIQAMPAVLQARPRARLLLAGEGPLRDRLTSLGRDTGVAPAVQFTGRRTDVPRLLAALDVFVLPSLAEGLPLSLLEAMAAGKPVVATPVGGAAELVQNEITGILIPPSDPPALARTVIRLLEERDLADRLGCRGRSYVVDRFSVTCMVQAYDTLYQSWLG